MKDKTRTYVASVEDEFGNPPMYLTVDPPMYTDEVFTGVTHRPLSKRDQAREVFPVNKDGKIQRNAPCPCNSGLKYKRCCLNKK